MVKDGDTMEKLKHFRFWCQKVLPLVYDNSLSYYEVLCKVVHYINKIIDDNNEIISELEQLKQEMAVVQEWIDNFDTSYAEEIIRESLMKMIIVGINDEGYIVYYIPSGWEEITFNTTELDIFLDLQPEYGHLVLSY